jgi:hypothetical protein
MSGLMSLGSEERHAVELFVLPTDPTPRCVDFIGATRSRAAGAC